MIEEVKEIDVNDRCAPSDEDDCELNRIEINFAIPTYLSQAQQGKLIELINEVVRDPKNEPKEGVHWLGFIGGKLSFSMVDNALLRRQRHPGDPPPPADGEEPTCQDDVLCLESNCRSFNSEKEKERVLKRREDARPSKFTCPKCGGGSFGSNKAGEDGKLVRYCNGRGQRGKIGPNGFVPIEGPDEPRIRCDFTWHEDDDAKYGLKPYPRPPSSFGSTESPA